MFPYNISIYGYVIIKNSGSGVISDSANSDTNKLSLLNKDVI